MKNFFLKILLLESKHLLEMSKQAVESAIEKGEKAGMKVLESA